MRESLKRETEVARRRYLFWKKLAGKVALAVFVLTVPMVLGLGGPFTGMRFHLVGVVGILIIVWGAMFIYNAILLRRLENLIQLGRHELEQSYGP